jgi:hypothetical protein
MTAQCKVCGALLALPALLKPNEPAEAKFEALSLMGFMHLLEKHPEHVNAACQPMMGMVANYVASLAFQSSDAQFAAARDQARVQIGALLHGLFWSDALKQFSFDEQPIIHKSVQP